MGLSTTDKRPEGISLADAYTAIRTWCRANIHQATARGGDYGHGSAALIMTLPEVSALSELEIVAVLREVILGYLEWTYHQSDGCYKMGAYAHSALEGTNRSFPHTPGEIEQLKESVLWPCLSSHVKQ